MADIKAKKAAPSTAAPARKAADTEGHAVRKDAVRKMAKKK
jgi:hypothetical protein